MLTFILFQCLFGTVFAISQHPILIVISYDAFRYDFIDPQLTPNIYNFQQNGTYTDYMINVFPTKTFPNHHSIATGLYPENHGILNNFYYDPDYKKFLGIGYELFHYNNNVVPIWRWNESIDKTRHSGSMMWPGGDYAYQGKNVTFAESFNSGLDLYERVDTVISWIMHPHTPANLVMLYVEEPDMLLHAFGPNSNMLTDNLVRLDNITGYLQNQLKKNHLADKVNIIHLSDHGIVAVNYSNILNISQYVTNSTYDWIVNSPIAQYFPHEGYEKKVYNELVTASENVGHFKVYRKDDLLERWHIKNNRRTAPILVMSEVGYGLDDLKTKAHQYAKQYSFTLTNSTEFGIHGYDTDVPEMRPFFMAKGPRIKKHHKVPPFNTVDLFNLFCEILDIKPTTNNGTTGHIQDILESTSKGKYSIGTILIISVGGVLIAVVLVTLAVMFTLIMIKRQQSITTTAALNKRFPQTFQSHIEAQHLLESEES